MAVSSRTRRISSRKIGGELNCACKIPRPPALLTAATNFGPVRSGPIGAAMIGYSIPSMSHSAVFMNTPKGYSKGETARPYAGTIDRHFVAPKRISRATARGGACGSSFRHVDDARLGELFE